MEPTGERYIPEVWGHEQLGAEHHARYRLATQIAAGRRVLDAGCGVGWGTELLLDAGASAAVGVDIADDALRDAQARTPGARFVRASLEALPLADASVDLAVCFEAIEHIRDPRGGLDELRRVLAPGGILLVSSPNPAVYPAGNPFHVHELAPETLVAEVQARLPVVVRWRQLDLTASVLAPDSWSADQAVRLVGASVADVRDQDPYSVVAASDRTLPALTSVAMFAAPPQALAGHQPLATAELERIRAEIDHDWAQIERGRCAQRERDHLAAQLLEAEQRVAALIRAASDEAARARVLEAERDTLRTARLSGRLRSRLRRARRR